MLVEEILEFRNFLNNIVTDIDSQIIRESNYVVSDFKLSHIKFVRAIDRFIYFVDFYNRDGYIARNNKKIKIDSRMCSILGLLLDEIIEHDNMTYNLIENSIMFNEIKKKLK